MQFAEPIDKRERPAHVSVYRDAAFLSQCSERAARDWLKNRPVEYCSVEGTPETPVDSHVLEYILYRRNAPLFDLALAQHGRSRSVLERVFRRGDPPTRVAACANSSLFVGDVVHESIFETDELNLLWQIIFCGSLAELRTVCGNPDLTRGFYSALIESWEGHEESRFAPDKRISSNRFKHILLFLSKNPRTSTPREESKERYFYDGGADYQYTRFFTKCWELAQVVPVEPEWAYVLAELYKQLHRPYDVFDDIEEVLKRWRPADEHLAASLYDDPPSPFPSVREQIAAKFVEPSVEMSKSDDPAIRQALYRTFDPEEPEFRELDWTEWLERDEWCEIWLSGNDNIWRSSRGRAKLCGLLMHKSRKNNDITDIGFFDRREEAYRKANPAWFHNEEDEEEYENDESEPDRVENLEQAVRELAMAYATRRSTDAIWFLVAALIGSFVGAAIWS